MPRISLTKRSRIYTLRQEGYTVREIAASEQVSLDSVSRIFKKKEETGNFEDKPKPGRPRTLSDRYERNAVRLITSGKCSTAVEVQRRLQTDIGVNLSVESVRRILRRHGLFARIKRKKPLLTKTHRKCRLAWANKCRNWTIDDWRRIIWSDESKYQIFGSDGRKYCWKKPGEPLKDQHIMPTVKFGGGSIMVWGCMSADGVGELRKIDGKMDADVYVDILNTNLLGSLLETTLEKDEILFQQDNDSKHTSKKAKGWFRENEIAVLDWPSQSPDLSPIENLWNEVDIRMRRLPGSLSNRDELWEKLQIAWNSVDIDFCERLIESMPERVREVIQAKGGSINR
jgi:transposase